MNARPFWYESIVIGVVWGFLLSDGVVFTGGCMTPPPSIWMAVFGLLFVIGVGVSLNWDIFSYGNVFFCIFL
jgi:hypothetical protein